MTAAPEVLRPPRVEVGVLGWIKKNLLSTWYNTLLTIASIALIYLLLRQALTWAFGAADWTPIVSNLKLFMVGQYPLGQMWRVGAVVMAASFLVGVSWSAWGGAARIFAISVAIGFGAAALLPLSFDNLGITARIWLLAYPVAVLLGRYATQLIDASSRWAIMGWLAWFFASVMVLRGFQGSAVLPLVDTGLWGGLLLTFLLALVGIVASFPLGVLLALGRRSNLPVVKVFCVAFIEVIRGVPLVSLLFMAQVIFPLFLSEGMQIDRLLRAMMAITVFSAAYMAENVRGGLQSVPAGQSEAARALGLNGVQAMAYIVLPQALRAVIPAIVGQFISLFKDTSLVAIIGLLDIVGIGKSIVLGNTQWVDAQREVYVFLAGVFWIFTYAMSYASRKLESALGVGQR